MYVGAKHLPTGSTSLPVECSMPTRFYAGSLIARIGLDFGYRNLLDKVEGPPRMSLVWNILRVPHRTRQWRTCIHVPKQRNMSGLRLMHPPTSPFRRLAYFSTKYLSKGPAARAFGGRHCGAQHQIFLQTSSELRNSGRNSCRNFGTAV